VTFDPAILQELAVSIDVTGYLRIMEARHRATPTGMGYGETRFASPDNSFTVLYAAQDLPTALAEKVVRDRFQGKRRRILLEADVDELVVASLIARRALKLLDLRTSGASRLGVPTDAVRGRAHQAGRRFSQRLYDGTDFDGMVYMSRSRMPSASPSTIAPPPTSIQHAQSLICCDLGNLSPRFAP